MSYTDQSWYLGLTWAERDMVDREINNEKRGLKPLDPFVENQICERVRSIIAQRAEEDLTRAPKLVSHDEWSALVVRMTRCEVDPRIDKVTRREVSQERVTLQAAGQSAAADPAKASHLAKAYRDALYVLSSRGLE